MLESTTETMESTTEKMELLLAQLVQKLVHSRFNATSSSALILSVVHQTTPVVHCITSNKNTTPINTEAALSRNSVSPPAAVESQITVDDKQLQQSTTSHCAIDILSQTSS